MNLNSRTVGDVVVVDVIGRLTSDGAGALGDRVARLIAEGQNRIVLNLGQLTYVDSSGLGEIVSCRSKVTKAGGAIRLAETTVRIKDLLAITRLVTVFDSYDTEHLALASLASPQEA